MYYGEVGAMETPQTFQAEIGEVAGMPGLLALVSRGPNDASNRHKVGR